jgi:hypothetical protein
MSSCGNVISSNIGHCVTKPSVVFHAEHAGSKRLSHGQLLGSVSFVTVAWTDGSARSRVGTWAADSVKLSHATARYSNHSIT